MPNESSFHFILANPSKGDGLVVSPLFDLTKALGSNLLVSKWKL